MGGGGQIIQRDPTIPRSKCRVWRLRMPLGRDPLTGKYKNANRTFHGTYREAQAALRLWQYEQEAPRDNKRVTVGEWVPRFLASKDCKETTRRKNRSEARAILMHLAPVRLCDLSPAIVAEWQAKLAAGESPSGAPLTNTSIRGARSLLSAALKAAKDAGVVSAVPDLGEMPANDTAKRTALDMGQIAALYNALDATNPHHVAIIAALFNGLRLSEVASMRWEDWDEPAGVLHVRGTKTAASAAPVSVSPQLAQALKTYRAASGAPGIGRVFPFAGPALGHWWARNRGAFGLGGFTFHDLRHSFVTMLARAGVHPSTMQALARHADPSTTLAIYTHVMMDEQAAAVARLGALMDGTNLGTKKPAAVDK